MWSTISCKRGAEVACLEFSLTLSCTTTIHKVQGLTLDEIVVDMQEHFSPGHHVLNKIMSF